MGSKQICNLSEVVCASSFSYIYAPETFCAVCVTCGTMYRPRFVVYSACGAMYRPRFVVYSACGAMYRPRFVVYSACGAVHRPRFVVYSACRYA